MPDATLPNLQLLAERLGDAERETLQKWLEHALEQRGPETALLMRLADSPATEARWRALEQTDGDLLREEVDGTIRLLKEALAEPVEDGLWAALFLACALRGLAVARVRHRLQPVPPPEAPSAFVYAMQ